MSMVRLPLAILGALLLSVVAARADGARSAALATQAALELASHTEELAKTGMRPDYSKPPASEQLRRIFDTPALLALPQPEAGDVSWLVEWGDAANASSKILLLFGAAPGMDRAMAIERNMAENEDLIAAAWDFVLRLQSRTTRAVSLYFKSLAPDERTETRLKGLATFREGYLQFVGGVLTTIAAGITPKSARLLTTALRDTAPGWVLLSLQAERLHLLWIIAEARKSNKDAEVLANLSAIATVVEAEKGR